MKQYRLKPKAFADYKGFEVDVVYTEDMTDSEYGIYSVGELVEKYPEDWEEVQHPLTELAQQCHEASARAGWYDGIPIDTVNKAAKISLIHSEISEALEGERKDLMDDKLPHRRAAEVEMADAVIRILDYCGWLGYDLGGAVEEKLAYNKTRPDHTREARAKEGGKKI